MSTLKLSSKIEQYPLAPGIESISPRLAAKDSSIWGSSAAAEASVRLGWVDLPNTSRALLPRLDALWAWARSEGIKKVLLCGMGGSSLAPEVIARSFGKDLIVVDSTDPDLLIPLSKLSFKECAVVISSKSGTTIETLSHLALFEEMMRKAGISPSERMIVVTDPNSPLDHHGREHGLQVFNADSDVGGRFSALTAFGLVPSALLGIDVALLLDDAAETLGSLIRPDNPAERLASFLAGNNFVHLRDHAKFPGLGDWIEQLVAESSGKSGKGVLPWISPSTRLPLPSLDLNLDIRAPLGAQFMLWEWSTALLGWILGVDPFNQPDVQATKAETAELLSSKISHSFDTTDPLKMRSEIDDLGSSAGYISICAFLNPRADGKLEQLRETLETRYGIPVTFGWGPRFLHSTGQFHKGGPRIGVFISITGDCLEDLPVPGKPFTFQQLIRAQAKGDATALRKKGLTVLEYHVGDRSEGIERLLEAFL